MQKIKNRLSLRKDDLTIKRLRRIARKRRKHRSNLIRKALALDLDNETIVKINYHLN